MFLKSLLFSPNPINNETLVFYQQNSTCLFNVQSVSCKTNKHLCASTFFAPYLHPFSVVVHFMHWIWFYLGQICIKFDANFALRFQKLMLVLHFLVVLFGTNLVNKISTKASNAPLFKAQLALFIANTVQI